MASDVSSTSFAKTIYQYGYITLVIGLWTNSPSFVNK